MQRRTVLSSIAALLMLPFVAFVPRKKLPPLRAGIKHYSFCTGGILDVTGTPEQLVQFYEVYQTVLWPVHSDADLRVRIMAKQLAKARADAQSGHLLFTLHGYIIDHTKPDLWTRASEAAVLATGCVLTEEAAQLMQLCGANIRRLPSCTEELC